VAIDLGAIRNVSKHWGAGASVFLAGDDHSNRLGAKLRLRRWLGSTIALDAAPGIIFANQDGASQAIALPGFVGELGLSLGDWVSVSGQVEAVRFAQRQYLYAPLPYNESGAGLRRESEVSWYLGAKLGGEAAMGTFVGALVLGVLVLSGGRALY